MKHLLAGLRTYMLAWLVALALLAPAAANQSNTWSPTTGTVSGLQLTTNYNNAFSAVQSCNSGASAPANDQTAAAVKGQCWLNTSTTPNTVEMYDGTSWVILGWLDTSNHFWITNNGGNASTLTAATTTDLCGASFVNPNTSIGINGTTTITSFGSTCPTGTYKIISFLAATPLTNSGNLLLPNNGGNITTAAGDTAIAIYYGSGAWRIVTYQRASGASLSTSSNFTGAVNFNGVISPAALASNTNNWNPSGLSGANVVRFSCSTPVNISGLAAPATDGQVLVLENIGTTNTCTLTSQDSNSSAANQFLFDKPIAVRPNRTVTIKYDATTVRWVLWQEIPSQLVMGGFKNLRVLNVNNAFGDTAPGTPNNQNKILLDEISLEDGNGGVFRIDQSYAYSCTIDITTSGAGGLDTGSVAASTWYYHWVIYSSGNNTASCLDSLSATAPTMPSGYTFKARVGANQTDASANKCFSRVQQYGRVAHYVAVGTVSGCSATTGFGPQVFSLGNSGTVNLATPTLTAKQVTGNGFPAPTTASRVNVIADTTYNGGTGSGILVAPSQAYSGSQNGPTGSNGLPWQYPPAASVIPNIALWMTLESNSLSTAASGSANNFTGIADWEDNF